jgi:hypothetical protein
MRRLPPSESEINAMMISLQEFAVTQADAACVLMADLWPIASHACMHDVCDSIDLWIVDHRSPGVVSKLTELCATHHDGAVRKHWLGLLSTG